MGNLTWTVGVPLFLTVVFVALFFEERQPRRRGRLDRFLALFDPAPGGPSVRALRRGRDLRTLVAHVSARTAGPLGPLVRTGQLDDVRTRLAWAGRPYGLGAEEFAVMRLLLAVLCFVTVALLSFVSGRLAVFALAPVAAASGYMLADWWLTAAGRRRQAEFRRALPHFVDLLATACEAGLNLPEAVERLSRYSPSGLLEGEFARAWQDIRAGKRRQDALQELAERNGVEELSLLVFALTQAEQYGTPVVRILRQQARQLRLARQNAAEAEAQRATVKVIFPVLVFIFIPLAVLMVGPAVWNLSRAIGW
ncbi:MAG TPA: hypothetical protein DEQ28_01965 [Clostridiales bacterium]|nr:hypothetical protein [Clostridiales bacterium]